MQLPTRHRKAQGKEELCEDLLEDHEKTIVDMALRRAPWEDVVRAVCVEGAGVCIGGEMHEEL